MINIQNWFLNSYEKSQTFKTKYNHLLQSSCLTNKNLKDFKNLGYNLSKLDIFKYVTVLEYLNKNKENLLLYILNPHLIKQNKIKNDLPLLVFNEVLEVNQYKNMIIDLYFLDIPQLISSKVTIN